MREGERDAPATLEMNEKTQNDSNEFQADFMRNFQIVLVSHHSPSLNTVMKAAAPPPPTQVPPSQFSGCIHNGSINDWYKLVRLVLCTCGKRTFLHLSVRLAGFHTCGLRRVGS